MAKALAVVCMVIGAVAIFAGFSGFVRDSKDARGFEHAPACGTAAATASPGEDCVLTLTGVVVSRRAFKERRSDPDPPYVPPQIPPAPMPPPMPPMPPLRMLPGATAAERVLAAGEVVDVYEVRVWLPDTTTRTLGVTKELYAKAVPGTSATVELWRDHPLKLTIAGESLKIYPPEQDHPRHWATAWAGMVLLVFPLVLLRLFRAPSYSARSVEVRHSLGAHLRRSLPEYAILLAYVMAGSAFVLFWSFFILSLFWII